MSPERRTMTSARRRSSTGWNARGWAASVFIAAVPLTMAQGQPACIPLKGSTTCPAFSSASISTDQNVTGLFPFLSVVKDVATFDSELTQYISGAWRERQYQNLLGCGAVNRSNDDLYARYSISVLCNGIVQNSMPLCDVPADAARPLCASDCAQYALSEEYIVANQDLCPQPGSNAEPQIRSDFEVCALPADALSPKNCIQASKNEPDNCGYGASTYGLCSYCASGGINSTDTCCYSANAEQRCAGVVLPTITPSENFTSTHPSATSSPTGVTRDGSKNHGLSGGAIAGIVIGSIVGLLLLALLLFFCLRRRRQRVSEKDNNIFNQPSPTRKGAHATSATVSTPPQGYEVLPGGRIARMSALEGHSGVSPSRGGGSARGVSAGSATAGVAAGFAAGRRRTENQSSSDSLRGSPDSENRIGVLRPPPTHTRRNGSLSSSSVLAGEETQSPTSAGGMSSSPPGVNSQQSEQLPFFQDYYSQDDIHPGDRVAVLWAYQPRANDEFALERGDMLKVVGIWDDGWATGTLLDERADEWEARRQAQRDSGVSNASARARDASPPAASGEIKAFPLVCVCVPDHWRKTIEGDGSTETGSSVQPPSQPI
ncbi:hypothetical protein F5Y17DRAFT_467190 [Xylariaceae sp. FL0594]|nr:hypothetical protein F5Y17DRAFT_467190 [Xylariaceae sp. FL0594]